MTISDAALPWVLIVGCLAATAVGGLLAIVLARHIERNQAEDDLIADAYERNPLAAWAIDPPEPEEQP